MEYTTIAHPFEPVYDAQCSVLILGSLPSVKSRENAFYYGHAQNRFWRMLSAVYQQELPQTIADKKALLLGHHVALWDVIARCDIRGSQDASIKNVQPNDIAALVRKSNIRLILLNGKTAANLYERYAKVAGIACAVLPSTSPANAAWTLERLVETWGKQLKMSPENAELY